MTQSFSFVSFASHTIHATTDSIQNKMLKAETLHQHHALTHLGRAFPCGMTAWKTWKQAAVEGVQGSHFLLH